MKDLVAVASNNNSNSPVDVCPRAKNLSLPVTLQHQNLSLPAKNGTLLPILSLDTSVCAEVDHGMNGSLAIPIVFTTFKDIE